MMFNNLMVMAIKHDNQILRENGNSVALPFGEEFSILIKNLNNRRAKVRVFIDGSDALDGTELVLNAKSEIDLKRFIKNGNMKSGNSFKFIERTESIENYRGINAEDGIVMLEFVYELAPMPTLWSGALRGVNCSNGCIGASSSVSSVSVQNLTSNAGITAPGSMNTQQFSTTYWVGDDVSTNGTMAIQLVGKVGTKAVQEALTVSKKPQCTTCGKLAKVSAKFCSHCGTSIHIF